MGTKRLETWFTELSLISRTHITNNHHNRNKQTEYLGAGEAEAGEGAHLKQRKVDGP